MIILYILIVQNGIYIFQQFWFIFNNLNFTFRYWKNWHRDCYWWSFNSFDWLSLIKTQLYSFQRLLTSYAYKQAFKQWSDLCLQYSFQRLIISHAYQFKKLQFQTMFWSLLDILLFHRLSIRLGMLTNNHLNFVVFTEFQRLDVTSQQVALWLLPAGAAQLAAELHRALPGRAQVSQPGEVDRQRHQDNRWSGELHRDS